MPPSLIELRMPVLALVKGRWHGTYIEIDPGGKELDRYRFFLEISFPDEPGANYRQLTRYEWSDGRTVEHTFDADLVESDTGPKVVWDHPVMWGELFEIDDRTLQLRFTYKGEDRIEVQEAMFLTADGRHRMRTWHWYRNGEPFKITRVEEARLSEP